MNIHNISTVNMNNELMSFSALINYKLKTYGSQPDYDNSDSAIHCWT